MIHFSLHPLNAVLHQTEMETNDIFTFQFVSQAVAEFNCTIVNRWGVTVHEITDIQSGMEWRRP